MIIKGDSLNELKKLKDNSIDSIITDPPYELGFMGKSWDGTGIAHNIILWKECLRVLKPGGYLLSFSGTRTYHRMASAIEDAGFEVRDMIEWIYSTGFPKSLNIAKMLDKREGVEHPKNTPISDNGSMSGANYTRNKMDVQSDLAKQWEGWGTALKPAHEPICMARKPLAEKTVAENCLKWGTGGINIDESRVEAQGKDLDKLNSEWDREWNTNYTDFAEKVGGNAGFNMDKAKKENAGLTGRFPANLIHDNSEEVRECFPNESERFFKSIIYQAKASKSERNKGCEGLEVKQNLQGLDNRGRTLEREDGSKTLVDRFSKTPATNFHPTVKPIALMEYLIKMVTPKGGIVLDPFAGSGSTLVAAKQNGFKYVGIEREGEYIEIIKARLMD